MSASGTEIAPTNPEEEYSPRALSIAKAARHARKNGRFRIVRTTVHRARLRVALKIDAIMAHTATRS